MHHYIYVFKSFTQSINNVQDNAATKSSGAFNKRIKLKIGKVDASMKGNVKIVRVVSVGVSKKKKKRYGDIEAIIESAFRVTQCEMPFPKIYEVGSHLKFLNQKRGMILK